MDWQGVIDWLTALVIVMVLYSFIPRPARAVISGVVSEAIWRVWHLISGGARGVVSFLPVIGYRWVLRVDVPEGFTRAATQPHVMSRLRDDEPDRTGSEPPEPVVVLPQQNQAEPVRFSGNEGAIALESLRNMSDAELIVLLAVLRKPGTDDYRYSANRIRDFVGGSDAAVKVQVAALRARKEQPAPTYRPLNPEQQLLRDELGLERKA